MASVHKRQFHIEVHTPEARVVSTDAVSVSLPARDGQLGILAGRAPLVAMVGAGTMIVELADGQEERFFLSGGFVQVRENLVTVLAEECLPAEWIDAEEAWQQLQDAKKMPALTDEQQEERDAAVSRARTKFNLAQIKRRREIERQRRTMQE